MNTESVFAQSSSERPILIIARNSSYGSLAGRTAAAQEVHEIVKRLAKDKHVDLRHKMPSVQQIVSDLINESTRTKNKRLEGDAAVLLEYVEYRLGEVVVLVATGSGKQVDDEVRQPFVELMCEKVRTYRPCVVAVNRSDRIGRAGSSLTGNFFALLQFFQVLYIDERSARYIDAMEGLFGGLQAMGASAEAESIHRKTRQGIARCTADKWDPRIGCAFAVAYDSPPGLIRVRMKDERGSKGSQWLLYDDPQFWPDRKHVAYGLPDVPPCGCAQPTHPEPECPAHHSNLADVMWALSVLGTPGWTLNTVGRELIRRNFSTSGVRRHHGVNATFSQLSIPSVAAWRVVRPIIARLDFYRTGDLPVTLNHEDVEDFVVAGVFPPTGEWATREDFERIDAYLAGASGGGPASLPLTGVPVGTVSGTGVLACAGLPGKRDHYTVRIVERTSDKRPGLTLLPHAVIADSIVAGLLAVADDVLIPVEQTNPAHIAAIEAQIADNERTLQSLQRQADALMDQIVETHPDGSHVLGELTRAGISQRYEDLINGPVADAENKIARQHKVLAEEKQQWAQSHTAVADSLLLRLVEALREPARTPWNSLMKTAIRIDEMTSAPVTRHGHSGTRISWHGTVRLTGAGQSFEIGFDGHYDIGSITTVDAKVDQIVAAMAQGVPFRSMFDPANPHHTTRLKDLKPAVGERLGWPARCPLMSCEHPLLTRVGTHLALHGRHVADTAAALGQPVELVAAVNDRLDSGKPDWPKLATRLGV